MKYNVLPKCPPNPPKMSSQKSSQTEMGGQILPFGRTLVTLVSAQPGGYHINKLNLCGKTTDF